MLSYSKKTVSQPVSCTEATYLTFEHFEKTGLVRHAFSTRSGGVSSGCFESMNLWFGSCNPNRTAIRDSHNNVQLNFKIFSEAVGYDINNTVFSDQVHGTELIGVTADDRGKGIIRKNDIEDIDGLVTNCKNTVLTTFYADCVPLFFLDPVAKVIALSHAGWKGTLNRMATVTVEFMKKNYHSEAEHIHCGIGPSIGGCCFEVDSGVADVFIQNLASCTDSIQKSEKVNKYFINLKQINKQILLEAGLSENNIEISDLCTKCNPQLFYSHRGMGVNRGQMAAVLELI